LVGVRGEGIKKKKGFEPLNLCYEDVDFGLFRNGNCTVQYNMIPLNSRSFVGGKIGKISAEDIIGIDEH